MCLEMKSYCKKITEGRKKGEVSLGRKRQHIMLSDLSSSAKYPEVKRAAEDHERREGWKV